MSNGNGRVCCILQVCCPPPSLGEAGSRVSDKSKQALVDALVESVEEMELGLAKLTAEWIFDNFDLVPAGVAQKFIEAYTPEFRKRFSRQ